jgi:hypothetical protein
LTSTQQGTVIREVAGFGKPAGVHVDPVGRQRCLQAHVSMAGAFSNQHGRFHDGTITYVWNFAKALLIASTKVPDAYMMVVNGKREKKEEGKKEERTERKQAREKRK